MITVIWFAIFQSLLGSFDTLYFHEYKLKLPENNFAKRELRLHALRDYAYAIIFFTFGWLEWHGIFAVVFLIIILTEIIITVLDFIEEDVIRKLPPGERAMHTIMAIIYGGLLSQLAPLIYCWWQQNSKITTVDHGYLSWVMTFFSAGVLVSGIRDLIAGNKLKK